VVIPIQPQGSQLLADNPNPAPVATIAIKGHLLDQQQANHVALEQGSPGLAVVLAP